MLLGRKKKKPLTTQRIWGQKVEDVLTDDEAASV